LSHDEVVHLKGSLLTKMPGDEWQKLANLRLLLAYMFTRPGKKLVFMGTELAPWGEWNHEASLDWHLQGVPNRGALGRYLAHIATMYKNEPAFWRDDATWEGFSWIDVADKDNSVLSYVRRAGDAHAVVALNLTPLPREHYRIGVPGEGWYARLLSSDDQQWGGSGHGEIDGLMSEPVPYHGYANSIQTTLPPLGALVFAPKSA
jgi:1,4-alpha-glucan branching enzyme